MKRFIATILAAMLAFLAAPALADCGSTVNSVSGPGSVDVVNSTRVNTEGCKPTYFAGLGGNTPAATPTDVAILTGSATKTVKVTKVRITVGATASGATEYRLVKRHGSTQSVVDTAFANGTHSGPMDSNDAASTVIAAGLAGVYTSNPSTATTTVGIVDDWTSTILANSTVVFEYTCRQPSRCITLRGTSDILAVNGNAHTLLTAEKFGVEFEWTEE